MSMFPNAQNVHISGGTFNAFQVGHTEPLKILGDHVVVGAQHNSSELSGLLKCYPGTRLLVLNEIQAWFDDTWSPYCTMWMNGPAGAGKSSIGQMFAQMCQEKNNLAGSFFFSRSSSTGRGVEERLIGTIVYQLCQNEPSVRPLILDVIANDPHIFGLSLKEQISKLIVGPMTSLIPTEYGVKIFKNFRTMLIVIDGLDECQDVGGAHWENIITAFVSALSPHDIYPLKLLVTSRPEPYIKAAFSARNVTCQVQTLSLADQKWGAYADIRKVLFESLNMIKDTHPLKFSKSLSGGMSWYWFSEKDAETIVSKSSGQFIYLTVVINYIKSIRHDPAERLKVIVGLASDAKNNPFATLDNLYSHIFSCVEDVGLVLRVLCIQEAHRKFGHATTSFAAELLRIPESHIQLAFNDLAAVIGIGDTGDINFSHASLHDFLLDKKRSGDYCIRNESIFLDLAQHCLTVITSGQSFSSHLRLFCFDSISKDFFPTYDLDSQAKIFQAISDANTIMAFEPSEDDQHSHEMLLVSFAEFLRWILNQNINVSRRIANGGMEPPNPLSGAINKIMEWCLVQFQQIPYSGFDNPAGIDFWHAVLMWDPTRGFRFSLEHFIHMWSQRIKILESTITPDIKQMFFCLSQISPGFPDSPILEKYAFTTQRSIANAHDAVYYFLNIPWENSLLLHEETYFWATHLQESLQHASWDKEIHSLLEKGFIDATLPPKLEEQLDLKPLGSEHRSLREAIQYYMKQEVKTSARIQDLESDMSDMYV